MARGALAGSADTDVTTLARLAATPAEASTVLKGELGVRRQVTWSHTVPLQESDHETSVEPGARRSYGQARGTSCDAPGLASPPLSHLVGLMRLGEVPALVYVEDERDEGEVPAA